jgi:hypothetical protein
LEHVWSCLVPWPRTTNITPLLWVQFPDTHHQVLGTHMATRVQWGLYFSMYKCPVKYNHLKLWNLHLLSHLGICKFSQTYLSNTCKYTILVHCRSIWVICVWGLETREKVRLCRAFSRVSCRIHIFTYMLRQCTCIVFILQF